MEPATTKPTKALTLTAAIVLAVMLRVSVGAAQSGQVIEGPNFKAWDLKFGLISNESGDWISRAEQNGTLGNREVSCRVYNETTNLVYPLPPEPMPPWFPSSDARYGLTFEYATTKPRVPYTLVITYPPNPAYPEGGPRKAVSNSWLPGITTGKTGRFCFYQWSFTQDAQIPGRRCYQVTIEGVPLPEICINVVNPNAK